MGFDQREVWFNGREAWFNERKVVFNGRDLRGCVYCLIVMEQNLDLMEEKYGLMVKIMFYLKRRVGLMDEKCCLMADK